MMLDFVKVLSLFLSFSASSAQFFGFPRPAPIPQSGNNTVAPITFAFTEWSEYSICNRVCGGGTATRSRQCLASTGQRASRSQCMPRRNNFNFFQNLRNVFSGEDFTTEVETIACNEQPCRVTDWDPWGPCSVPCGGGVQTSARRCVDSIVETECNFQSTRRQDCGAGDCFQLGAWGNFGDCNRECNGGVWERTRQCEVRLDPSDPEYGRLQAFINQMNSFQSFSFNIFPAFGGSDQQQAFIRSYRTSCGRPLRERGRCNARPCPTCPANQVYYQFCRPCEELCQLTTTTNNNNNNNIFQGFGFGFARLFSPPRPTGCNGVCERGCGCPTFAPLLGSDGSCYRFASQCPINRVQTVGGRNFQSTVPINRVTDVPTTTTTTTTTTPATTSTEVSPRVPGGQPDPSEIVVCDYDIIIATIPGTVPILPCTCFGRQEEVPCQRVQLTSCPVICRRS